MVDRNRVMGTNLLNLCTKVILEVLTENEEDEDLEYYDVRREEEKDDCFYYIECFDRACRIDALCVPCVGCTRYARKGT